MWIIICMTISYAFPTEVQAIEFYDKVAYKDNSCSLPKLVSEGE